MRRALVQVPAFREPDMGAVLEAIAAQPTPSGWSVDLECWVTSNFPDPSDDPTWQVANDHPAFQAFEAPSGKLSARNRAHADAADRGADVFLTWDADTLPAHDDVLATILEEFRSDNVVAVNSRPYATGTLGALVGNFLADARRFAVPHLHGQCSAIRSSAWEVVGPFDDSVDQLNIREVWGEEEIGLYRDLVELGRIPKPKDAIVYSDNRRSECRIERVAAHLGNWGLSPWCERRGQETFIPEYQLVDE